jgi:hypothetical protein
MSDFTSSSSIGMQWCKDNLNFTKEILVFFIKTTTPHKELSFMVVEGGRCFTHALRSVLGNHHQEW